MIVFVLALLPLIAAGAAVVLCRMMGWRGGWLLPRAATLSVVWIWLNACGLFNSTYDRWLEVDAWASQPSALMAPPTSTSDPHATSPRGESIGRTAIIVLGGGTEFTGPHRQLRPEGESIEKIALAANTYQTLLKTSEASTNPLIASAPSPLVIVSGGDPEHHGAAEADTYAPELVRLGIPAADLIAENRSQNTYQNAEFVAPLLAGQHVDRLILITTAMHMRRSILDFARFNMHVEPLAPTVVHGHITLWPDVENLKRAGATLHEIIGILQFRVYRALKVF